MWAGLIDGRMAVMIGFIVILVAPTPNAGSWVLEARNYGSAIQLSADG